MTTPVFSERRAADRKKMATAIEQLVVECGSTFTREEGGAYPGPHVININITSPGGLELTVDFDGKSPQPNVHVLSWHMGFKANKRLNNATFCGDVNQAHFRKATYVARGFDDLCVQLRAGLLMCKDGTAYLPDAT
jgi:hypothetical protein